MSNNYTIKRAQRKGESYQTMIIIERSTGAMLAEYALNEGEELKQIRDMRKSINEHLDNGGGLHNYQW